MTLYLTRPYLGQASQIETITLKLLPKENSVQPSLSSVTLFSCYESDFRGTVTDIQGLPGACGRPTVRPTACIASPQTVVRLHRDPLPGLQCRHRRIGQSGNPSTERALRTDLRSSWPVLIAHQCGSEAPVGEPLACRRRGEASLSLASVDGSAVNDAAAGARWRVREWPRLQCRNPRRSARAPPCAAARPLRSLAGAVLPPEA